MSSSSSSGSGSSSSGYPQFLRPFHPAEAALAQEQLHSGMGRFDFGGSSSGGCSREEEEAISASSCSKYKIYISVISTKFALMFRIKAKIKCHSIIEETPYYLYATVTVL